ncbi:hypothetical protein [Leyella stercorea]|uniref:hypothetical protein n=1 Tax=Leyella stercorea TaxID=363265 RepID=UPI002430B5A7|nr:hypothetical protein [Leyella stercorea]
MRKLIAFLLFLLTVGQGATAQEVSGLQLPLPKEEIHPITESAENHQLATNAELHPITPTYSDILMMKVLSSSELLAMPNMPNMPIVPMPFATAQPLVYGYDASRSGTASMEVSKNLRLTATGAYRSYIGLMDVQSVSGGVQYSLGGMTVQGALAANRYLYYGRIVTQYGVSGQLSYSFNPNLALTVFGTYYNTNPFFSMAAFPFVPTTSYGGYMTVGNRSFYVNLGVERRFNAFEHKMETVPIITPAFKISNKVTIELPLGDLTMHLIEETLIKSGPHRR